MACRIMTNKDGRFVGFACGRGHPQQPAQNCQACLTRRASKRCDWPVGDGRTCDRWLCDRCARHVSPDLDYCPHHGQQQPVKNQPNDGWEDSR